MKRVGIIRQGLAFLILVSILVLLVKFDCIFATKGTSQAVDTGASELVSKLKVGWNLGNSLDAVSRNQGYKLDTETLWGNPKVTKKLIHSVKKNGFSSIRIPVTYYNHLDSNGKIDTRWLARVKEVVNYALAEKLYVIINVHHDAGLSDKYRWIYSDEATYDIDKKNLMNLWSQIAKYFKNEGSRLLFESTNEIMDREKNWAWSYKQNFGVTAKLHNEFIKTVRATGGKNATRYFVLPTYAASSDEEEIRQILNYEYEDTQKNHLIMSVHCYKTDIDTIAKIMNRLGKYRKKYNVPVIMDEFGVKNDITSSKGLSLVKKYREKALENGVVLFWWDNGSEYGLFDRTTGEVKNKKVIDILTK